MFSSFASVFPAGLYWTESRRIPYPRQPPIVFRFGLELYRNNQLYYQNICPKWLKRLSRTDTQRHTEQQPRTLNTVQKDWINGQSAFQTYTSAASNFQLVSKTHLSQHSRVCYGPKRRILTTFWASLVKTVTLSRSAFKWGLWTEKGGERAGATSLALGRTWWKVL